MNALQIAIASVPLAIYCLMLGAARLRQHPLVTSGWRDFFTLGIACSGLAVIGPMQLFFPTHAAARWPGWVWLIMLALYLLALLIASMWTRPRLIAYGLNSHQFRQLLLESAAIVDPGSAWLGDVLTMPNLGLQLAMESTLSNHVQSAGIVGFLSNYEGWIQVERQFVKQGSQCVGSTSRSGWILIAAGMVMLLFSLMPVVQDPALAMNDLRRFLFR